MMYAHPGPFPFGGIFLPLIIAAALWTVILKGYALWYAARAHQKWWFIALLVINTVGILEIIYLIWFRPKTIDTHAGS
jgi:methionyl-tRNA synthetase